MPTYEYECDSCNYSFEAFHSMSSKPLKKCPQCQKNTLQKLISGGAAVIIKGTQTPCFDRTETLEKKKAKREKIARQKKEAKAAEKKKPPWWRPRKDKKIDMSVLKNPEKYIRTGEKN